MPISTNAVGLAGAIVLLFGWFGIEVEVNSIVDAIAAVLLLVSLAMQIVNQFKRKDVKWFFLKK